MDDMHDEDMFPFEINYSKILEADDMMAITQECVRMVTKNSYTTPGEFFASIMNGDLQEALEVADNDEDDRFSQFMLIAEMLSRAEGLEAAMDHDEMLRRVNLSISFTVVESLARKKLVKVYRENYSFGEDMNKAIIVEKLSDGGNL